jgi:ABC-type multidrug transport system permease subunit
MSKIWKMALNDLRLTVRDRSSFVWMLAMPIAMMWFFGGIGGGGAPGPPQISLTVDNRDDGWLSTALIEELTDERLVFQEVDDPESSAVRTLVIPEGFTRQVLDREQQTLQLVSEPGSSQSFGVAAQAHIVRGIVRSIARLIEMEDLRADDAATIFARLGARPPLVSLDVSNAGKGRPVPSGLAQSVPGNLTFVVMMMTLIYGGVFLTMERAEGMLRRQAVLPMSRGEIYLGKLTGRMLMSGIQIVLLLVAGRFLFGVSWGDSPLGLGMVVVSFALAVAGLSTLLGLVARTPGQASSVGWLLSMVLAALGGCWWPAEVMPDWLRTASNVLPTAWAMDGFHSLITFGHGVGEVVLPSLVLLGFAVLFSVVGIRVMELE